ncbi:thiazole biosynthesis adenylyltransferase ThiF [Priestia flexa]|uniref:thiazole biosynthesis adenylyltransferase ThiF n=1 Tax=Priestia flexa TaxID=86664 RepID=UPI001B328169
MTARYSRQELFSPIGKEGQKKLSQKHILLIGAGALGTGNAEALVRAGVGKLTIIDRDYVEWSNLQRQQLYSERDAANRIPKAVAASKRLAEINGDVDIEAHVADGTPQFIEQLLENVDLIIDATDNFDTRLVINDLSQKYQIPWIYGACVGSYGISYTIVPGETPCLACLLESVPLGGVTCDTVGIISPAVQMVVAHQVTEALKILVEDQGALRSQLVSFDVWKNEYRTMNVHALKTDECTSCGQQPVFPALQFENQLKTAVLCGRDTVQIRPAKATQAPNIVELEQHLKGKGYRVDRNPYLLSVAIDDYRLVVFQDGRIFVHGTKDTVEAKNLYHRYIG